MTNPPQWGPPPGNPFDDQQQYNPYPGAYQQPTNPYQGGFQQPQVAWPGYSEAPPLGAPPPKRNHTALIVATVAVVLVAAVVVGGLLWKFNASDDTDTAADTTTSAATTSKTPSASSAPTSAAAPTTPTAACEGKVASPAAETPPGWLAAVSPRGLGYDVPPDWTVNSCTTLVGWEKPCPEGPFGTCPVRMLSGSASMPNKQCPDGYRGVTGTAGAKDTEDVNAAVQQESQTVADIYTSKNNVVPNVSLSPPRNLTVAGQPAVQIVATVTGIEADNCTGPAALHSMVATKVPGQPGSVVFVVSLEQGYAGAPGPGLVDQLVGTLRTVG